MAPNTPLSILMAARKLIAVRRRWTKGFYARSASGRKVCHNSKSAVRWCVSGALLKVGLDEVSSSYAVSEATECLNRQVVGKNIVKFNDDPLTTHSELLAAFDRAISLTRVGARHGRRRK